jgi:hypothetical protein
MNFKRAASMASSSDSPRVEVPMVVVVWAVRVEIVRWTVAHSAKEAELGRLVSAKAAEHSGVVALATVAVLLVVV